ncbi:MAG: response regulator [Planctomycetes bacterium]|nr:response regulator [Planctomycetota bacterium]
MNDDRSEDKELRDEDLRALGRAATELSHELRNLLVGVVSQAEILASGRARDPAAVARRIRSAANDCKDLVEDVLSLGRRRPRPEEPIDLLPVVEDTAADFSRERGPAPVVITRGGPFWIKGREGSLHRVLLNLLRNADEAGPEAEIRIELEGRDDRILLRVRDQGPGIPAAAAARVFEPFYSDRKIGGTGLGLAIARRIIEEHGGRIELEKTTGGASFLIELPTTTPPEAGRQPRRGDATLDGGLHLLCIDDDETTRETYRMILGLDGHEVDCAATASEGLRLAAAGHYDAVLSDLRLPDLEAAKLVERLAAAAPGLERRLLFATGDLMNDDSRRYLDSIGRPYLAKPFRIEDLRLALELLTRD